MIGVTPIQRLQAIIKANNLNAVFVERHDKDVYLLYSTNSSIHRILEDYVDTHYTVIEKVVIGKSKALRRVFFYPYKKKGDDEIFERHLNPLFRHKDPYNIFRK
jgi:hypothetical protein